MKLPRFAILVLLPSVAAAWPTPSLPEVLLEPVPFTLVQNALDAVPKIDFFAADKSPEGATVYVSHMPIKVPQGDCDPKMVAGIDPSVDYKLTVIDPDVARGK